MFGEWLSLVEHLLREQGVGGSNPLSPTIQNKRVGFSFVDWKKPTAPFLRAGTFQVQNADREVGFFILKSAKATPSDRAWIWLRGSKRRLMMWTPTPQKYHSIAAAPSASPLAGSRIIAIPE